MRISTLALMLLLVPPSAALANEEEGAADAPPKPAKTEAGPGAVPPPEQTPSAPRQGEKAPRAAEAEPAAGGDETQGTTGGGKAARAKEARQDAPPPRPARGKAAAKEGEGAKGSHPVPIAAEEGDEPQPARSSRSQEAAPVVPTAAADKRYPPALGPDDAEQALLQAAGAFFAALHKGDAAEAARLSATPFQLDGRILPTQQALATRLDALLARAPLAGQDLYGVRVMPAAEMVERHGPPPARLGPLPLEGSWVAIGNVGGMARIALFRKTWGAWRAVAYTD